MRVKFDLMTPGQQALSQLVDVVLHASHIRVEEVRYHAGGREGRKREGEVIFWNCVYSPYSVLTRHVAPNLHIS